MVLKIFILHNLGYNLILNHYHKSEYFFVVFLCIKIKFWMSSLKVITYKFLGIFSLYERYEVVQEHPELRSTRL